MNTISGLYFLIFKTKSDNKDLFDSNSPSTYFRDTISSTPIAFAAAIYSLDLISTIFLLVISLSFDPLEPVVPST